MPFNKKLIGIKYLQIVKRILFGNGGVLWLK